MVSMGVGEHHRYDVVIAAERRGHFLQREGFPSSLARRSTAIDEHPTGVRKRDGDAFTLARPQHEEVEEPAIEL